jgi:hypothetical protein
VDGVESVDGVGAARDHLLVVARLRNIRSRRVTADRLRRRPSTFELLVLTPIALMLPLCAVMYYFGRSTHT